VGETKGETHPATYAPAGSCRGVEESDEIHEALGAKGPKAGQRVNRLNGSRFCCLSYALVNTGSTSNDVFMLIGHSGLFFDSLNFS
jgi:hypothetical protein